MTIRFERFMSLFIDCMLCGNIFEYKSGYVLKNCFGFRRRKRVCKACKPLAQPISTPEAATALLVASKLTR